MEPVRYEMKEWVEGPLDKRHLSIRLWMYVRAYVRQTRMTRFRKDNHGKYARDYVQNQGDLRDVLNMMLKKHDIEPFGKIPLGCAISVYGPKAARPDLGNLEKAVEDAANGSVWHDDRYVYERGPGKKQKDDDDLMELTVWEL